MIIGANGTGKSSIVAAIALGLGGKPEVLGRAKSLSEFVQAGKAKGSVSITLHPNTKITRFFSSDKNTSTYELNGEPCSEKIIKAKVLQLNIQISNLCSFLPQDKVCDFAALSPQALLKETQRALDPSLLSDHEQLMELGREDRDSEKTLNEMKANLEDLKSKVEQLEGKLKLFEERNEIVKEGKLISGMIPFAKSNEMKAEYEALKSERDSLNANYQAMLVVFAPLEEERVKHEKLAAKWKQKMVVAKQDFDILTTKLTNLSDRDLLQLDTQSKDILSQLKRSKEDALALKTKIQESAAQIKFLENELKVHEETLTNCGLLKNGVIIDRNAPGIKGELLELKNKEKEILKRKNQERDRLQNAEDERSQLNAKINRLHAKKEQLHANLTHLNSLEGKKLAIVKRHSPETLRVYEWIQNNLHLLKRRVYGPICIEINPTDVKYADAIESQISQSSFLTFVCESQADYETLSHELVDKLGWRVNLFCPDRHIGDFVSRVRLADIQRCGFDGYLADFVDAPDIILVALCQLNGLHNAPVALKDINHESFEKTPFYGQINSYVSGRDRYTINSNYGQSVVRSDAIKRSEILNFSIDSEMQRKLDDEMAAAQNESEEYAHLMKKVTRDIQNADQVIQSTKDELAKIVQEINEIFSMRTNYIQKQRGIDDKKATHRNLLQQEERDVEEELRFKLKNTYSRRAQVSLQYAQLHKSTITIISNRTDYNLEEMSETSEAERLQNLIETRSVRIREHKEILQKLVNTVKESKVAAAAQLRLAEENLEGYTDDEKLEFRTKYEDTDYEDLNDMLIRAQARIASFPGIDQAVINDYKDKKQELVSVERNLEDFHAKSEEIKEKIDVLKNNWSKSIEELVAKIDVAFSTGFEKIGCVGTVGLIENVDFEKWSIQIKVKFRESEDLQILTGHRQSGGERSVFTILYLMSLQELSQTPFRVVDEINQGMDPRNERLVHGQLVETACKENTSQYFLITPKLLPDLTYHENMKVLCVFNGEHQPAVFNPKEMVIR